MIIFGQVLLSGELTFYISAFRLFQLIASRQFWYIPCQDPSTDYFSRQSQKFIWKWTVRSRLLKKICCKISTLFAIDKQEMFLFVSCWVLSVSESTQKIKNDFYVVAQLLTREALIICQLIYIICICLLRFRVFSLFSRFSDFVFGSDRSPRCQDVVRVYVCPGHYAQEAS